MMNYLREATEKWLFHFARSDIVKATMPMYSADMEMIQKVEKIAKKVFKGR